MNCNQPQHRLAEQIVHRVFGAPYEQIFKSLNVYSIQWSSAYNETWCSGSALHIHVSSFRAAERISIAMANKMGERGQHCNPLIASCYTHPVTEAPL